MGFFAKIKNFVTGGAAEVSVIMESPLTDGTQPIRAFVMATAKDDCNVKKVYFHIRGRESYIKRVNHTSTDGNGNRTSSSGYETCYEVHFEKEMILAEAVQMTKGETLKWLAEFEIPQNALATYHGKDVNFKWEVEAGLDMPGVDPDSGWIEFIVNKQMQHTLETA